MIAATLNNASWNVVFLESAEYAKNMRYENPLQEHETNGNKEHQKAFFLNSDENSIENSKVKNICDMLKIHCFFDDELIKIIEIILSEIFDNFYAHANTKTPPICCVQNWLTSKYIEIALADIGIGIRNSLKNTYDLENINACELACGNGISSKIDENHSGYGLFFTKRFIQENNGTMSLNSQGDFYIVSSKAEYASKAKRSLLGTCISLVINKEVSVNCEDFFQKITKEQCGEEICDEYF